MSMLRLALSILCPALALGAPLDFPVEPGAKYRLSFTAAVEGAVSAPFPNWEIRMVDAKGRLPYEGHLKAGWQVCTNRFPREYRHTFYTPTNAASLRVLFHDAGGVTLRVENVRLEKADDGNLLPGPPEFTDLDNYSGWNERSKASLVQGTNGVVMRVLPGGYAWSDLAPVKPVPCRFGGDKASHRILFLYDADMRYLKQEWPGATWTPSAGCAYIRIMLGPGETHAVSLAPVPPKAH